MKLSFIIIDDRELDCFIAGKYIEKSGLSLGNKIFYEGASALNFIKDSTVLSSTTVILLDIMMPVMDGFQFLEAFEDLADEIKGNYRIIPVTTSLNENDISRISEYKSVITVLKKPYTYETLVDAIQLIDLR